MKCEGSKGGFMKRLMTFGFCLLTLSFFVGSQKEIDKAVAHTKSVKGVRGIKSFLRSVR